MNEQIFNKPRYKPLRQNLRNNPTEPEQRLWQVLRGKQMGVKFRRQHGIGAYIVDFYSPECHLVIELDGDSHYTEEAQAHDRARDAYLHSLGLRVLRFTNEEVLKNLEGVYEMIRQATPSRPPPSQGEE